jgi:hypothetical protein
VDSFDKSTSDKYVIRALQCSRSDAPCVFEHDPPVTFRCDPADPRYIGFPSAGAILFLNLTIGVTLRALRMCKICAIRRAHLEIRSAQTRSVMNRDVANERRHSGF